MNEQEFVLMQIEWLHKLYNSTTDPDVCEALIRAVVDITSTALVEDVFPAFDTDMIGH